MILQERNTFLQSLYVVEDALAGIARITHPPAKRSRLVTVIETKALGGSPQHSQRPAVGLGGHLFRAAEAGSRASEPASCVQNLARC